MRSQDLGGMFTFRVENPWNVASILGALLPVAELCIFRVITIVFSLGASVTSHFVCTPIMSLPHSIENDECSKLVEISET